MIGQTNAIETIQEKKNVHYKMLYSAGNEYEDVTGGWITGNPASWHVFTKNTDNLVGMLTLANGNGRGGVSTVNKIPLANYNNILMVAELITFYATTKAELECRLTSSIDTTYGRTYGNLIHETKVHTGSSMEKDAYIIGIDYEDEAYVSASVRTTNGGDEVSVVLYHMCLTEYDNWETLASIMGITASSIDDILSKSSQLFSNENAVKFMVANCTGDFMINAIKSYTFTTALNGSAYKTLVQANEHWSKFLNMVA